MHNVEIEPKCQQLAKFMVDSLRRRRAALARRKAVGNTLLDVMREFAYQCFAYNEKYRTYNKV